MIDRRQFLTTSGLGGLALAGGLWPRGAFAQTPVWFSTPFHGGDAQALEIITREINEEQSDIRFDLTQGGWTEYYAQMYNAVVAGVAPNLGISHNFRFDWMSPILYPLEDTPVGNVLEKLDIAADDFIPKAWEIARPGGVQYGIPLDQAMLGLYYNRDIFREAGLDPDSPPSNREEFEAACEAIQAIGKIPYHPALAGAPRWIRRSWYILYWGMGGDLIENEEAAFNDDRGHESLQYLVDMVHERGWNEPGTDANAQFLAGELGMCLNGTWFYLTASRAEIDFAAAQVPQFFDQRVTWGSTHNLVLPQQQDTAANRERLEATIRAIGLFLPKTWMWGVYGGHVPMYVPALEDQRLRESDTYGRTLQAFSDMAFGGVFRSKPEHPKILEFDAAVEPHIQEAYNGTISVQEALDRAEQDANAVLAG